MTTEILVPEMGESVLEATVSRWLKREGDFVDAGEVLVELETDKVNVEVGARSPGVLAQIKVQEGGDVKVGDVLGLIDEEAEQPVSMPDAGRHETGMLETPKPGRLEEIQGPERTDGRGEKSGAPQISPVAHRLAQENDVDIGQVTGTGPQGRVSKADVQRFIQEHEMSSKPEEQAPAAKERQVEERWAAASTVARREERERMSRRRRTIAQRLLEAQHGAAMLTTFNEVDMSAVMNLRKRRNEDFQARYGVKLGIVSFFVKAAISALKEFPRLNAEIQEDEIVLKRYYDIGMAIGSEEGLVVPVLRDADRLSFAEIERSIKELVAKTEQGKLAIEDLRGGTFTITNGGIYGSLLSTPILNPPQVGILGLHKISDRPVVLDGEIVIRPMMYVALSYDHRIVDGREAVQFLVHIKEVIEDPGRMLVEG